MLSGSSESFLCSTELVQLRLIAWLCNDPATTRPFSNLAAIVTRLGRTEASPVEPGGYKGASVSRSPGAGQCTWVPLGVLARLCGRAPRKTHRQQMASVVFHPSMRLLLALSYKTHRARGTNREREGNKPQTHSGG